MNFFDPVGSLWKKLLLLPSSKNLEESFQEELSGFLKIPSKKTEELWRKCDEQAQQEWQKTSKGREEYFSTSVGYLVRNLRYHTTELSRNFLDALLLIKLLDSRQSKVLDFGCGVGSVALALAYYGFEVNCADISPLMLKFAKRRFKLRHLKGKFYDLRKNKLPDNYYHAILLLEVLEVTKHPEKILEKISRAQQEQGILVINYALETSERNPEILPLRNVESILAKLGYQEILRVFQTRFYQKVSQKTPKTMVKNPPIRRPWRHVLRLLPRSFQGAITRTFWKPVQWVTQTYHWYFLNKKFIKLKPWLIACLIFLLAFVLRTAAAFKIPWRPDEIVYVDWIGGWFKEHFWQYLFQFSYKTYPPEPEVFGNPPLAMWLMTFSNWFLGQFGLSPLIASRLMNVFFGALTAVFLFYFGKRWFSLRIGFFSALAFSLLPILIVNNATAYLDTFLTFLILLAFHFSFLYLENQKKLTLYFLAIILGLSLLTKFTILPIILILILAIFIFSPKQKEFFTSFVLFLLIVLFIPTVSWSGLRDFDQLKYLPLLLTKDKNCCRMFAIYPVGIFSYYWLMILGVLPSIISFGFLAGFSLLLKKIVRGEWRDNKKLIILFLSIPIYLAGLSMAVPYSGSHNVLPILPLLLVVSFLGIFLLVDSFKQISPKLIYLFLIICLALPIFIFTPQYWGLYGSSLVGGPNKAFRYYTPGAQSEGLAETAEWLNQNTSPNSTIAVMAYDWTMKKYIKERNITSAFLNDNLSDIQKRDAKYLVIPRLYLEGEPTNLSQAVESLTPIAKISYKGIGLFRIYQIDSK